MTPCRQGPLSPSFASIQRITHQNYTIIGENDYRMALSIFGAGVGRTGTLSLKLALERLGCGPCYHMREVFDHLDTHVPLWDRAADGDNSVWDALFEGYHSGVDFPVGSFYRELSVREG